MNSGTAATQPIASARAVVFDAVQRQWLELTSPLRMFTTTQVDAVAPLLAEVEAAVEAQQGFAAGWVTYEASPAFDAHLSVKPGGAMPLLWFALFQHAQPITLPDALDQVVAKDWVPTADEAAHGRALQRIHDYIEAGDTYQVNYTYRLNAAFDGDPWRAFLRLVAAQQDTYGAFIDTGDVVVCSASPELYLRLDGQRIESKPMKGTAARGLTTADDLEQARALRASDKERAENVMIVDMVRNDLGRIARTGSVQVPHLFTVEKYPTIWTMTSTVVAETDASLSRIFAETFPPASITGAPKRRTMEIINELETTPRGVYTGAVGFIAPKRVAQFNVAIRTLVVDKRRRQAEYGVGSGIVWDSEPAREWQECQAKTRILSTSLTPFDLLETLKWSQGEGYGLLERHLARLAASADYFGWSIDIANIRKALHDKATAFGGVPQRIRLLVTRLANSRSPVDFGRTPEAVPQGFEDRSERYANNIRIEHQPLSVGWSEPVQLVLAAEPLDSHNRFLYHKTTNRQVYEAARAARPQGDDVILYNERGEVCETTIANLIVEIDGRLCTPPVHCGLLPGTLRDELVARGDIIERVITLAELKSAANIRIINSVRGEGRAVLIEALAPAA